VNDQRVMLPTLHAKGTLGGRPAEFFILDDPDNPLALHFQIQDDTLTVIRISFPSGQEAPQIERTLQKEGRAEVYGIYFDFGSAEIKKESEPTLQAIADLLTRHAGWRLGVEGHTDSIGSDAANLDLSRRRAAAVRDALVQRYHIAGERLATAGYGASRPKETNETAAGRARNRRVELVRQ